MTIEANVSEQDDIDNATALSNAVSILTLITGEPWSKQKLLETNLALKGEATKALSRQGLTKADAAETVEARFAEYEDLHTPLAEEPTQQGFRTTMASEERPSIQEQLEMAPMVAPTREQVVAKATARIEEWKARKAAEKAAQEEAATLAENAAPDDQI